jgi:hypothetical protein
VTFVYQMGDHDPSGIDAWRDLVEKTTGFLGESWDWARFRWLAVTKTQVRAWQLPTRPTKTTDPRSGAFSDSGSVEIDAIPASTLRAFVEETITDHLDPEALRLTRVAEQSERDVLTRMVGRSQWWER